MEATPVASGDAVAAAACAAPTSAENEHLHVTATVDQAAAPAASEAAHTFSGIPHTTTVAPASETTKKTGRPAHPLWAHFHRGEKRNRYHYHAFCVYCVERYGAEQVPATRGVSIDMLRHLEKCTNCPRRVVEMLKQVCGQRDAVRFDRYGKKKLQQQQQQQAAVASQGAAAVPQQHGDPKVVAAGSDATSVPTTHGVSGTTSTANSTHAVPARGGALPVASRVIPSVSLPPPKRLRVDLPSTSPTSSDTTLDDKIPVLKLAVAAHFTAEALQNDELQQLLCLLRPSLTSESVATLLDPPFVQETAHRLAAEQLDRVKEGMLNSTIKGGLTLSLHSWTTLDRQFLVAFNLVNSNGDSACVCVEDMSTGLAPSTPSSSSANSDPTAVPYTTEQLAAKIEQVLSRLQEQNISVMGIVADTTLALNAARRVCLTMNKRQSLLVVPCFSRVLSVLAGAVLTHPHFVHVVGEMIEIAAYLLNTKVLTRVRALSGDSRACFVLPNRENWFSFVDCHSRLLRYRSAIVQYCESEQSPAPHVFKTLVLRDNQSVWQRMDELRSFLAPLHETYSVFFQQIRSSSVHDGDTKTADVSVDFLEDDLAAAHGLTLAHVMYQFARMTQQYQTLLLTPPDHFTVASHLVASQDVAQLVLIHVDTMWRRYELPAMLLAFVFNFHLETTLLDMSKPCSAWPSITEYFQVYYQRWFHSGSRGGVAITRARIAEILDTIKQNHFPFDADTTSDYVDVSSFYSFVSDSHPEICALCCRLYAISLLTANVSRIVSGIGYVPIAAQTTRDPESVELLLHVGFASSMRRNIGEGRGDATASESALGGMEAMIDGAADSVLWSEDLWQGFADDWRLFVDQELLMDEFDVISNESASGDAAAALLAVKVPVQELFLDTLPAMTVTLEVPASTSSATAASNGDSMVDEASALAADATTATDSGVISVGI